MLGAVGHVGERRDSSMVVLADYFTAVAAWAIHRPV
jgi:hypothetical protein